MLERQITSQIVMYARRAEANSFPIYGFKVHGGAMVARQPDLLFCVAGRFVAMEVKQPGKRPTAAQQARLRRYERAGAVAVVVTSLAEAKAVFRDLCPDHPFWGGSADLPE